MHVDELLEDFEVGKYQRLQSVFLGAIFMIDGGEVLLSSSILGAMQEEWRFGNSMKGMMASVVFIGILFGTMCGGIFADSYGRRKAVLCSYVGIIFFTGLCAAANGPWTVTLLNFLVGFSFGGGGAASAALTAESVCSTGGKHLLNALSVWFLAGEVYVAVLLVIIMPRLTAVEPGCWRTVVLLTVAPTVFLLPFMLTMIKESPQFLLSKGRKEEAIEVLRHIALTNGRPDLAERLHELEADTDAPAPPPSETTPLAPQAQMSPGQSFNDLGSGRQSSLSLGTPAPQRKKADWFETLFVSDICSTVWAGCYLCFLCNLLYYGSSYILPQVFAKLPVDIVPAVEVLLVSLASLPGLCLVEAMLLVDRLSDRGRLFILVMLSCALELGITQVPTNTVTGQHAMLGVACGLKAAVNGLFNMVFIFVGRAFPADNRCFAISFCFTVGRLGSIFAPPLCELSVERIGGPNIYFYFCGGCCVLAVLVLRFLLEEFHYVPVEESLPQAARKLLCGRTANFCGPRRWSKVKRISTFLMEDSAAVPPKGGKCGEAVA